MNYVAKHGEDMNEERKSARSKMILLDWPVLTELAEFVTEFIEKRNFLFNAFRKAPRN
jgi:hypothetical protein